MEYSTIIILVFLAGMVAGWYLDVIGKLLIKHTEKHNRRKEDKKNKNSLTRQ